MAKPPLKSVTINGSTYSYFQILASQAQTYLAQDGVAISFEGYYSTVNQYADLTEQSLEAMWSLAKDLNAWSEYFSGMANLIQKMYLDAETSKIEINAISSVEADGAKVANGDRLANKDVRVVEARKKRNTLKAFFDELEAKVKFLERAHYHCKATYELNMKQGPKI